ncbi:MAG TPA: type III-A CRISPR-associated RAMP protein Csm3 [Bacteroidales bacterium]|nr:type III-A CRISPR-associated RAMP protein Csm3 [Bacteroidales bacterium]
MELTKLNKKIFIKAELTAKTGLHVGGSNLSMAIGGADAVVVRNPITQEPYIPGSSIKGKMRSLTEKLLGAYEKVNMGAVKYGPYQGTDKDTTKKVICDLYGTASNENQIPSRLIVRDGALLNEPELKDAEGTDMLYTEVKTEVVIDRVTSAAMPRQLERVPAGAKFKLDLILNVFENDDEEKLINYVLVGLHLLEDDYLGGSGSRGSGQIEFDWDNIKYSYKDLSIYEKDGKAQVFEPNLVSE